MERPFDLVYRYHDIKSAIPDADERQAVQSGLVLHVSVAARIYDSPREGVTYENIAAGAFDTYLEAQARGIAGLGVPVFVTFEQEANQHRKLDVRGTAEQFIAAWRHIHEVYAKAGARNAVWVWVMTGAAANLQRAGTLWPGNDVVDWISWNVYNQSGCGSSQIKPAMYQSFDQAVKPFYNWVHKQGPSLGIDPGKPMMISESGSVLYKDDHQRTADWYAQIPDALQALPQIKAVTFWASATSAACDYRFQQSPTVVRGVAAAVHAPSTSAKFIVPRTSMP